MTPEEELSRAERARQILEDPMFSAAVNELDAALLYALRKTAFNDSVIRNKVQDRYAALHDVLDLIRTHIETGKLARAQIEQQNFMQRMKERIYS